MTASPQRTDLPSIRTGEGTPSPAHEPEAAPLDLGFDQIQWEESAQEREHTGAGGRAVLGAALIVLAIAWTGFTAWSAARSLGGQSLTAPAAAQWLATFAAPLAVLGLAWLVFGRTRRKEAERFTRSVIAMRSEARSLEGLLQVVTQRINDSRSELTMISQHLMKLGDEATGRLGGITREFDASTDKLARHSEMLDRTAESARNDMAVLLEDLPSAEATARAIAEQLRSTGHEAASKAAAFELQVGALADRTRETDAMVGEAAQRLVGHLTHIESAGAAAATRVGEAESGFTAAIDSLLDRTAAVLGEIRSGIDTQSQAVTALVEQASAGLGKTGAEAAEALGANLDRAAGSLDALSARVAEQERGSQRLLADIERGLTLIDQRFTELAANGDERANHFLTSLSRARVELDALAAQAGSQDGTIEALAGRTLALRETIERLAIDVRDGLAGAISEAESGTGRIRDAAAALAPEVAAVRDAVTEAGERLAQGIVGVAQQRERFEALLASVDEGVAGAEAKLASLTLAMGRAQAEAARLTAETGPALVDAMVQVREAATHAAERAREAISGVIPSSASELSEATRAALERTIREQVEDRLREVETLAARAVEAARSASERLTQQMLTLGQSATALEQHVERTREESREKDSEAFARRVSLLIDSMNSAAIDVGKILSDEIDEKAWDSYMKGNRGIFTRRAVRLLGGSETRAIRSHYETEPEFAQSVNRYVHDFEAMLRRVLAERDGAIIAVTLMSSDMGKLYAALAQVVDRRR